VGSILYKTWGLGARPVRPYSLIKQTRRTTASLLALSHESHRQKYCRRFLWFSAVLVAVVTVAGAYSIYVSQRVHYGDLWDQAAADLRSQDAWAMTQALAVACGGLFISGALVFTAAWISHPKGISREGNKDT
jgi:hypothetical protein